MSKEFSKKAEFKEWVEKIREKHEIPGLSVGLMKKGEVIYARGFGYADKEREKKARAETIHGIASITKSFTALGILLLEEKGYLSTGDPVVKYLPEFDFGGKRKSAITIHHFLTHTSGLPPTPALMYAMRKSIEGDPTTEEMKKKGDWEKWEAEPPLESYEDLMDFISRKQFAALGPPGAQLSYSNDCYALLGTIIERVSGRPLAEFLKEEILAPLGMEQTTFDPNRITNQPETTQLYARVENEIVPAPKWNHAPSMLGAGFLKSSVFDLLKYGEYYLRQDKIRRRIGSPYFPMVDEEYYGYGFLVQPDYFGHTVIEHGGSLKGISSNFGFVPQKDLVAVVLINLVEMPARKIWSGLINLELGLDPDQERFPAVPLSKLPETAPQWPGLYCSGEGARVEIRENGQEMEILIRDHKQKIEPVDIDKARFIRRGENSTIQFLTGPRGEVDRLHLGMRILEKK